MIIAINQRPYDGPWGGGNRFVQSLCDGLKAHGHEVVHRLSGPIDIILMIESRPRSPNVTFGAGAVLRYLVFYPNAVVIQRINECDERKGEKFITHKLVMANYAADLTVFVGGWMKNLAAWKNKNENNSAVILNGADDKIFNRNGFLPWIGSGPVKLVTHHWGFHRFKGFDVYEKVDSLLDNPDFAARFSMNYVGRLPLNYKFRNINVVAPLDGERLADKLRSYHAYLTGSINEPGGNHQNEGACCGLPLVYRNSGCMPEYCADYGLGYDGVLDIEGALNALYKNYGFYVDRVKAYPHTADRMVGEWLDYFQDALRNKREIVAKRKIWRNPFTFLKNQIPV